MLSLCGASAQASTEPSPYIVVLKAGAVDAGAVAKAHSVRHGVSVGRIYRSALRGYSARVPEARLAALREDESVAFVSPDRSVRGAAQVLPTGIDRIDGDFSSAVSGNGSGTLSSPAVAVLDSGSGPHPDINRAGGKNCQRGTGYDDINGHGTHVAGAIAGLDDASGIVGAAPGAKIYSVRVLDASLGARLSNIICGIDWVTANAGTLGIKVANMSLTSAGADDGNCGASNADALHRAICASTARGVTYVASAGNDTKDLAGYVPASYNEVLTVTAAADFNGRPGGGSASTCRTDVDDTAADFSNFTTVGSPDVMHTIAAPGVCTLSSWRNDRYETLSGTSMAAPHVAGAATLCIASGRCGRLSPAAIVGKLRRDAAAQPRSYGFRDDPNSPNGARYYGYMIRAGNY